jgi:uncharacterized OB-fold protein
VSYEKPLPIPNADTEPFWTGCKAHQLRFQRCRTCGLVRWPASILCPECHGRETEWIVASGRGHVFSFIVYHEALHPAFEQDLPYVVAIVELDEGPRLLTNIVGCSPDEVHCDMPVEVVWDDVTEEIHLPKFRPRN